MSSLVRSEYSFLSASSQCSSGLSINSLRFSGLVSNSQTTDPSDKSRTNNEFDCRTAYLLPATHEIGAQMSTFQRFLPDGTSKHVTCLPSSEQRNFRESLLNFSKPPHPSTLRVWRVSSVLESMILNVVGWLSPMRVKTPPSGEKCNPIFVSRTFPSEVENQYTPPSLRLKKRK